MTPEIPIMSSDPALNETPLPYRPRNELRDFGAINTLGLWTLYTKEVQRFLKLWIQSIAAPAMISLLFLMVFSLVMGDRSRGTGDIPFLQFLAPGLIMMAVIQNSFQNSTTTLIVSKHQGNIFDVLMPPLTAGELMLGIALGGITRGLIVATVVGLVLFPFVHYSIGAPLVSLVFVILATSTLSIIGVMVGIWANKFDDVATMTNFIVTPLAFLSGTFYSVERLPSAIQVASNFNPFFYMIDGFRYGFIGQSDSPVWLGLLVLFGLNIVLWTTCYFMLATGFKLKD